MGTWGHGNLESDGALDVLSRITDALFTRVIELLQHPNGHEYDSEEIDELVVRIEMLLALHKRGMVSTSLEQSDLGVLFDPYLKRWEAYYGSKAPPKRRKVIEKSFKGLLKMIRQVHSSPAKFVEVPLDPDNEHHKMMMDIFDSVERANDPSNDKEK